MRDCVIHDDLKLTLAANDIKTLPPQIGKLTNLKWLSLDYNQLVALPPEIANLSRLEELYVGNNPISDSDLEYLKPLENLKTLDIRKTQVTKEAVANLKYALPNCVIMSEFRYE